MPSSFRSRLPRQLLCLGTGLACALAAYAAPRIGDVTPASLTTTLLLGALLLSWLGWGLSRHYWRRREHLYRSQRSELRDLRAQYDALIEQSLVGIYILKEHTLIYANQRASEMLGYPAGALAGKSLVDLMPPGVAHEIGESVRRRHRDNITEQHYVLPLIHRNGHRLSVELHSRLTEFRGERVIAAIDMPSTDDGGQLVPLALGTRNGVVKRWNRESPTTMDSWSVIDLKDDDEVLAAAEARDEDRLVFVSTDSSLLTFEAKNVRPQGRTAGGMAGIRLAEGCSVAAFAVVPDGKVTWNYEEGENGLFSASGAVVLTVAGDSEALPGTENGAAKVTPLEMYPTKGRGTGGVRSQRFLKGQDTLILAFVGAYPLHASTQSGAPVELPKPDMRRDGSGTDLSAPIAVVG